MAQSVDAWVAPSVAGSNPVSPPTPLTKEAGLKRAIIAHPGYGMASMAIALEKAGHDVDALSLEPPTATEVVAGIDISALPPLPTLDLDMTGPRSERRFGEYSRNLEKRLRERRKAKRST